MKSNRFKEFLNIKTISYNALIAALYIVLTYLGGLLNLSYGFMQFRFSEFLMLLVFFNPYYTLGLTLGCLISNIFSSSGIFDILLGSFATLLSCILMILLSKKVKSLFLNGLIPCIINALIVPLIIFLASINSSDSMNLTFSLYFMMFGWVMLGEILSINVFGYIIFMILKRINNYDKIIDAKYNQDFKW